MKEIGELVANLLCWDKQSGIAEPNFLVWEWMYSKFKFEIKIKCDVFSHKSFIEVQWTVIRNVWSVRNT